jgi:hypothetical protein
MTNLTLKERERLAYINGDIELAKVLGELKDAIDEAEYNERYCTEYGND